MLESSSDASRLTSRPVRCPLNATNRLPVILGQEPMLSLGFIFQDGADQAMVGLHFTYPGAEHR
jgi:hypothetical protein